MLCKIFNFLSYELLSSQFLSQRDGQTDRQTESDTYELTVLIAQVSSKKSTHQIVDAQKTDFYPTNFL